ncbi:MAG: ClbS/DfsB family four-helix bundle protein [Clostridiales Family XIII bacterium]|jgi:hypothetical protein|nr:ClbS/DfsB family four-helix bundle protein [Clostridiales Family XIII bacterium]
MWELIDSVPSGAQSVVFDFGDDPKLKEAHWKRDKNMRDVLVHLYEWHQLLLGWAAANLNGDSKPFLPAPFTWATYGDMNVEFWKKHQSTPYDEAAALLRGSHAQVMTLIESFSNEELFEKKHFPWTGTTNVGSYCISATASHYDWAMKKIKQYIRRNG